MKIHSKYLTRASNRHCKLQNPAQFSIFNGQFSICNDSYCPTEGHRPRPAYTLLEVILAIGIGLLLVAALYVALDVQFRYMQSGREAIAEGQLARGLLNRVASDIRASLGKVSIAKTETGANALGDGQVNYGLIGDEYQMTLFISNVPRYGRGETNDAALASDLRTVTYYLIPDSGLARLEIRQVTADDPDADIPPDILGEEVIDLQFQYYDADAGEWVPTWDGTENGPPLAVEITMGIQPPRESAALDAAPKPPVFYRKVVAVPSANLNQTGGIP